MAITQPSTPIKRAAITQPSTPTKRAALEAPGPTTPAKRKRAPLEPSRNSVAVSSFTSVKSVASAFGLAYAPLDPRHLMRLAQPAHPVPARLPCLMRAITTHALNFDRRSEAICRTTVDMVLNECLVILKDQDAACGLHSPHAPAAEAAPRPSPFAQEVLVNGEVAISYYDSATATGYVGRVDYSVGLFAKAPQHKVVRTHGAPPATTAVTYPYSSCILLAEAKKSQDVDSAETQLCAYLAILRANRIAMQAQANPHITASVYGLATDGLKYTFMSIDAAGTVRVAKTLHLVEESDAREIVSALIAVLEGELVRREQSLLRSRPSSRVTSGESDVGERRTREGVATVAVAGAGEGGGTAPSTGDFEDVSSLADHIILNVADITAKVVPNHPDKLDEVEGTDKVVPNHPDMLDEVEGTDKVVPNHPDMLDEAEGTDNVV
ncbi:hypothetical protein DFH27DRAFT_335359 [Peziza echinospora]|nr:hypothetical protein DFH27DRAFT_335359 [Peziza echinospora]